MSKIVERPKPDAQTFPLTEKAVGVGRARVRGEDGALVTIRKVDASGAALTGALTYLFRKNVERAREENLMRFGSRNG